MAPNADRLWLLASAVKAAIVEGYSDADAELPDRQYVTVGNPAHDCEQLVVAVENTFGHEGAIQQELVEPHMARPAHALRASRMAIHLLRCWPVVGDDEQPPTPDAEEEAAELALTDSQLLLNVIVAAQRAGDLPRCGGVAFEQWTALTPSGGIGGGVLRVRLTLE